MIYISMKTKNSFAVCHWKPQNWKMSPTWRCLQFPTYSTLKRSSFNGNHDVIIQFEIVVIATLQLKIQLLNMSSVTIILQDVLLLKTIYAYPIMHLDWRPKYWYLYFLDWAVAHWFEVPVYNGPSNQDASWNMSKWSIFVCLLLFILFFFCSSEKKKKVLFEIQCQQKLYCVRQKCCIVTWHLLFQQPLQK